MTEPVLKLPRLSGSEAQALTTLARHGVDLPVPSWPGLQAQTATLNLRCMPSDAPLVLSVPTVRIAIEWAGAALWLDWPLASAERWLAGMLGTVAVPQLAPEWLEVARQHACHWLTQALGRSGRGSAICTGWSSDAGAAHASAPASARHHLLASLQVQGGQADSPEVFHGVLHTDSLGLLLVAGLVADHAGQAPLALDAAALAQPMTLCLGESQLPLSTVQALRTGQVVLMQQRFAQGDRLVCLRSESAQAPWLACQAQLDNTVLHILSLVQTMTLPETAPAQASSETLQEDVLAPLPVRLSFDLGETVMTLAQLKALQPGESVALQRPAQEYVTIRANGMPIGTGQLVEIDGRLGVTIGSLGPAATRPAVE